jgi:predicted RNase H-like nuclease (RuvC/YqgF family)
MQSSSRQAMTLQQSMARLGGEMAQAVEEQQRLDDPRSTVDQLQHTMQADWAQIEILKNTVRELQETTRQREASLAELGLGAASKARCELSKAYAVVNGHPRPCKCCCSLVQQQQ